MYWRFSKRYIFVSFWPFLVNFGVFNLSVDDLLKNLQIEIDTVENNCYGVITTVLCDFYDVITTVLQQFVNKRTRPSSVNKSQPRLLHRQLYSPFTLFPFFFTAILPEIF